MKVIGLIGGCGAGKTEIINILKRDFNAYIIVADAIGHEMLLKGEKPYELITDYFGQEILDDQNEINRRKLAQIVFADKAKLSRLNQMTHPYIYQRISEIIERVKSEKNHDLIVLEASIMVETGFDNLVEDIWFVYCQLETRISRLMSSRNLSRELILDIINNQQSDAYYSEHADVVIDNSYDIENTYHQIKKEIALVKGDY
jgi:dephospho-CoA kinase